MKNENRNNSIDIAKGIGIICVAFSHLTFANQIQRNIIHAFNMPLFFLISGFLYKEREIKENFIKGARNYLFPAYIFLGIDMLKILIKIIINNFKFNFNINQFLKGCLLLGGYMTNAPLWFLPTIFIGLAILNLVFEKKYIKFGLVILSVIYCCFSSKIEYNGFLWPISVISSFPFLVIGSLYREKIYNKYEKYINSKLGITVQISIFIILAIFNGYSSMIEQTYGKNYILFLITGCLGTNLIISFSKIIDKKSTVLGKNLGIIGKYSILILLTHYILCRNWIPKTLKILKMEVIQYNLIFQLFITGIISILYLIIFKLMILLKKNRSCKSER